MTLPTALVSIPTSLLHHTPPGHPERPERLTAILEALAPYPLLRLPARAATLEELALCHTPAYLALLQHEIAAIPENAIYPLSTGDVTICHHSWEAACFAAGGVLTAIDAVMRGQCRNAFVAIRPPGHHACADRGMGFCLLNNVAIGTRYLQQRYGIQRVLIVDWDVHHGNGTDAIFANDPSVFYCSTHQAGIYPGTGSDLLSPTRCCQQILPGPHAREELLAVYATTLTMAMEAFRPEVVCISCGFDAHELDPLGGLNLTAADFATLTGIAMAIAERYAAGRCISVLEGGYSLKALALASTAHVQCFLNG